MPSLQDIPLLLISGIFTLLTILVTSWSSRKKTRAETSNIYTEATERLVHLYENRDKEVQEQLAKSAVAEANCLANLAILDLKVQELTQQIKDIK